MRQLIALIALFVCAGVPGYAKAADANQCAIAADAEKRIATVLQLPAPCRRDDECKVAHHGCPFPCASAVSASQERILESAIKDYRNAQAAGECPVCKQKCDEAEGRREAKCVANRCVLSAGK